MNHKIWLLAGLIILGGIPFAQADQNMWLVALDIWEVSGDLKANITIESLTDIVGAACNNPTISIYGHNANDETFKFVTSGSSTQIGSTGERYYRNATVNSAYDTYVAAIIWQSGVCTTDHYYTQSFRQSTFRQTNLANDANYVSNDYANATFEGQTHANQTWCESGPGSGKKCVSNDYANSTFCGGQECEGNFSGNFTTFSGEVLGSAIPTALAVPGFIILVSMAGVGVAFISRINPMPSLFGAITQLLALGMWLTQSESTWTFGTVNLEQATFLMIILAFLGLSFRTYLMMNPANNGSDI